MYSAILRPEHLCKQIRDGYNTAEYLVGAYCKQNLLLIFASRSQLYKSCRISWCTARYMVSKVTEKILLEHEVEYISLHV